MVNNLTVRGRDQVMLKVTVAEVQRDIIKQLGIDLNGSLSYGSAVIDFANNNPFTALGQPLVDGNGLQGTFKNSVRATLARDGEGRRHPYARRAEPHRDLGRERELPRRRRISGACRLPFAIRSPATVSSQFNSRSSASG